MVVKPALVLPLLLLATPVVAQEADLYAPSVWDLEIGAHASDLPTEQFINYACGTNGGPPSRPITDWTDFGLCRVEAETGLREVFFQYDNELELWAKAHDLLTQIALYQYTSIYAIPIIASALFDDDGFMIMLRLVTDPDIPVELRELAVTLEGYVSARFGVEPTDCFDLAQLEGERPYNGRYQKRRCEMTDADGHQLVIETHHYRKPGQFAVDPVTNRPREGQFWSETRLEVSMLGEVPDREGRLAEIALREPVPTPKDLLVARALDCPGCDFVGADFKRADLTGANLAGANLAGAKLHEAILMNADLTGANLDGANLNGVQARLAILAGASMRGAIMFGAVFDGADLSGADLSDGRAGQVSFARATLMNTVLVAMDLRGARINDANLRGADFRLSWADDAQLTRSDLSGAILSDSVLTRINLNNALLIGATLLGADLLRAELRGADVSGADFSFARLTLANLSDIIAVGTIWDNAALPVGFTPD